MKELEKWKTINSTETVDELHKVLEDMGPVEISGGRGPYDMAERLRGVESGEYMFNMLTRNYGIRQQYIYLTATR